MNSSVRAFRRKRDYIASKPNTLIRLLENIYAQDPDAFYDTLQYYKCERTIASNPNITWEFIKKHNKIPWPFDCVSAAPNLTWDIINSEDLSIWYWPYVSANPNITWDIVQRNLNIPWSVIDLLANNPSIIWNDVREYCRISRHSRSLVAHVICNKSLTIDIIRNDPVANGFVNMLYDYGDLKNCFIQSGIIDVNNVDLAGGFAEIKFGDTVLKIHVVNMSYNPNITWDFIKKCGVNHFWKWGPILLNIKLSKKELFEFWDVHRIGRIDYPANSCAQYLSANPNMTWEIISETLDSELIQWDLSSMIQSNPCATIEIVAQIAPRMLLGKIEWGYLKNPNITYKFICDQGWCFANIIPLISANKFLWDDTVYAHSIKKDIEDRVAAIKSVLNTAVGHVFDCVARYIDYV